MRQGDWASAVQPRLALVGSGDLWIYAYFEQTKLPAIHLGDAVDIGLMAGGTVLGQAQGIAYGIADPASRQLAGRRAADLQRRSVWPSASRYVSGLRLTACPRAPVLAAGISATLRVTPTG